MKKAAHKQKSERKWAKDIKTEREDERKRRVLYATIITMDVTVHVKSHRMVKILIKYRWHSFLTLISFHSIEFSDEFPRHYRNPHENISFIFFFLRSVNAQMHCEVEFISNKMMFDDFASVVSIKKNFTFERSRQNTFFSCVGNIKQLSGLHNISYLKISRDLKTERMPKEYQWKEPEHVRSKSPLDVEESMVAMRSHQIS